MNNENYYRYNNGSQQHQRQNNHYPSNDNMTHMTQQYSTSNSANGQNYSPNYSPKYNDKYDISENDHQQNNTNNSNSNSQQSVRYYNGFEDEPPVNGRSYQAANSVHSNNSRSTEVMLIKPEKKKSKYLPWFPCIRSTCGRVTACFCIIILIAIIVIVILIFTVFKIPTVEYKGPGSDPEFSFNTGNVTMGMNMIADIEVNNPNPIGFTLDTIDVTVYIPNYAPSIGGGVLHKAAFPSKGVTLLHFPLNITYDRSQDPGFTVVQTLLTQCGLTGSTDGNIDIKYDAKATLKIIGISISHTIKNQSIKVACPVNISDITKDIPANIIEGIGGIVGDIFG
ncbi:hypothetical protein BGZ76_001791 [Entomortierella beljakovae]|nr:hypothetical protein BGZ76_001791 [Entomortierella beljakovae]